MIVREVDHPARSWQAVDIPPVLLMGRPRSLCTTGMSVPRLTGRRAPLSRGWTEPGRTGLRKTMMRTRTDPLTGYVLMGAGHLGHSAAGAGHLRGGADCLQSRRQELLAGRLGELAVRDICSTLLSSVVLRAA